MKKIALIASMAAGLFMVGCASSTAPKLDETCVFKSEYYEPKGDSEIKIAVYSCEKGEVEVGR